MYFNRQQLKNNAKIPLSRTYWVCFLVCMVSSILGSSGANFSSGKSTFEINNFSTSGFNPTYNGSFNNIGLFLGILSVGIIIFIALFTILFSVAFQSFISNIIHIGKASFFLQNRKSPAKFTNLFDGFKNNYINKVFVMFMQKIFIFLWSLLLVIPGIIASYSYFAVPYLMVENPNLSWQDALDISKRMTEGKKWDLFILDLSFFWWIYIIIGVTSIFLGIFAGTFIAVMGNIGVLFLIPYVEATRAEAYEFLKQDSFNCGNVHYNEIFPQANNFYNNMNNQNTYYTQNNSQNNTENTNANPIFTKKDAQVKNEMNNNFNTENEENLNQPTKDWTEINVKIKTADVEKATDICQMTVPYGVYIEDYSDLLTEAPKIAHIDLIDEDLLEKDRETAIIHIYISPEENPMEAISFLKDRFACENIEYAIDTKAVIEEQWATAWKKYYHPMRLSEHLVVCPSWEKYEKEYETDKILTLDPGMAFGTGTHDTTRLCVTLLDKYAFENMEMLDVGCGSGILAISASLFGSGRTVGVDIDEMAVRVARDNAKLNNRNNIEFICGDLVEKVEGTFDVICANIVADVIIRLSSDISKFLRKDGTLVVSGIIEEREQDVVDALSNIGLTQTDRCANGGWVALAYKWRENA